MKLLFDLDCMNCFHKQPVDKRKLVTLDRNWMLGSVSIVRRGGRAFSTVQNQLLQRRAFVL